MRILWSLHLYPPMHNCGSEYVAHNVNQFLISRGHQVRCVLHYDQNNKVGTPYTYEGVECVGSKTGQSVDTYRWADVILTHLDMTQFTILMAKQAKRSLVHFVHNDIPYSSIENNFGNVSAVYNSKWIADKIGYKIPGYVLHPPCDTTHYDIGEPTGDAITLISLNFMKGGYFLRKLAMAMPDRKFIGVIGSYDNPGKDGPKQNVIVELLRELPNVEIVENSPDILSVYRRTRILIMPSYYESWGRTATEAMCSGIPVICTPTPGLKENCADAGIYVGHELPDLTPGEPQVELGKVEDWVKAIRKLDNPAEYRKKSLLCRERARELGPMKELEGLEAFLYEQAHSYR